MRLVTSTGRPAPTHVKIDDYLHAVTDLAAAAEWERLASAGVYREIYEPGTARAGYAPATLSTHPDDGLPAVLRPLAGTEAEWLAAAKASAKAAITAERNRRADAAIGNVDQSWRRPARMLADAAALNITIAVGASTPEEDAKAVELLALLELVEVLDAAAADLATEVDAATDLASVDALAEQILDDGRWT